MHGPIATYNIDEWPFDRIIEKAEELLPGDTAIELEKQQMSDFRDQLSELDQQITNMVGKAVNRIEEALKSNEEEYQGFYRDSRSIICLAIETARILAKESGVFQLEALPLVEKKLSSKKSFNSTVGRVGSKVGY